MPLSEYEQRVLDELERDLGADAKLGRTMARPPRARGRFVLGVLGIVLGLGVVLGGAVSQVVLLGVAGFAIMIGSALWVLLAPRSSATPAKPGSKGGPAGRRAGDKKSLMNRLEERFERRREQGDL